MPGVGDFEEYDFFTDSRFVADPYPYFADLRDRSPVLREPHRDVVMITGYDEAVAVCHDPKTFSSCLSVTGPFPGFPVPLAEHADGDITDLIEKHRGELPMNDQLPTLDPPVHTDHRALLMRLITPKRLKESEEHMWELADRMLDPWLTGGQGEFIHGLAGPFTLLVIADLLGVPEEDQAEFREALQHRPAEHGVGGTDGREMALNPLEFLYGRFTAYIDDRRANPRADVLTGLAQATFPDGSLPEVIDVVRIAANLFSAGQETTVRLLGAALQVIGDRPDIQAELRADRSKIPNFIEECLRHESPVKGDFRLSRVPTTVGGVDLPAGTTVMVVNGAANRDPRRFPEPDVFDLNRENARHHMSFGRGIHTCPGAPLARAEARAMLERLLDRTTDIRISEKVHGPAGARRYQYIPTFILRGVTHLALEFDRVESTV